MSLFASKSTLYHTTTPEGLRGIEEAGSFYGCERKNSIISGGSLTLDKKASQRIAWDEKVIMAPHADGLVTLAFLLPKSMVKKTGYLLFYNCDEFATTLTVAHNELPASYRQACRLGGNEDLLLEESQAGRIRFYKVPLSYRIKTELVDIKSVVGTPAMFFRSNSCPSFCHGIFEKPPATVN